MSDTTRAEQIGAAATNAANDMPYERDDYSDQHTHRVVGEAVIASDAWREAVRTVAANAWDEGHRDVCIDCNCRPDGNPYRITNNESEPNT